MSKIPSSGWSPEPDDLSEKGLHLPHLWHHPQKKLQSKTFQFFKNPN